MGRGIDYDWAGAAQAKVASGLGLRKFYDAHVAEYCREERIPCYDAWARHIQQEVRGSAPYFPTAERVAPNVRLVTIQDESLPIFQGADRGAAVLRMKTPSGGSLEFESSCPELFALQVLKAEAGR